jgi:hypothetical protein
MDDLKMTPDINGRARTLSDGHYLWDSLADVSYKDLTNGQRIYQGQYLDPVTGRETETYPDKESYSIFLNRVCDYLENEKNKLREKNRKENEEKEISRGFGWCDRCGSYCYGDCKANLGEGGWSVFDDWKNEVREMQ